MLKSLCKTLFTLQGCRIHTTSQVQRKKPSKPKGSRPKPAKGRKGKDSKPKDVKKSEEPIITIPEPKSHTLRKHDNIRRCKLYEFGLYVGACLPKYIQKVQLTHGDELELLVAPEGLYQVNSFLKLHQHACFTQCSLVTAIDVPQRTYRFEVIYNLLSFRYASRVRVKTYTDEVTPLPSAYSIWRGVNWYEREVYDMYGVVFANHPDLRRILTDYGFPSHPLRKDFPLIGYTECRYDDELKKIVYEPVEFAQEGRRFQLNSPWNYFQNFNTKYNNPPPPPGPPRPPPPPPPPKKK